MELNQIETLVEILMKSDSKELNVTGEFAKIKIVRSYDEEAPKVVVTSKAKIDTEKAKAPKVSTVEIKSTLVGKFHFDKEFKIGDKIIVGEKIGYVESLKTKTDITSDYSGYIVEIPTIEGDVVEYGQTIIVLE